MLFELADQEGLIDLASQFRRALEESIQIPLRTNWVEVQLAAGQGLKFLTEGDLDRVREELDFILSATKDVIGKDLNQETKSRVVGGVTLTDVGEPEKEE
ncbi:hypothetical protein [uncultured Paludibaculum sp.]|uniref:hypothetical protein n=1 Tax=uncultured Paludibaculum sp. TaxID=1765020 RepID=UPI002AABFA1D|nr:hypothetical protein [uncultured Paludibaculum sp.]